MKIIDFPSSELEDARSIQQAVSSVQSTPDRPLVLLVAPMGDSARKIMKAAQSAVDEDLVLSSTLAEGLRTYTMQMAQQVTHGQNWKRAKSLLAAEFEELSTLLQGLALLGELTERGKWVAGSYAERAAVILLSYALKEAQVEAEALSERSLFASAGPGRHPDGEKPDPRIQEILSRERIAVLPASLRGLLD